MTARREFDITLFGATGFTGRLTAGHLATHGADARIALAGRSMARLAAVRESLGPQASQWELVTADSSEPKALQAMAERTRLVVSTVGPYTLHGMPLVGACADTGTDYADLTAEPGFVRESIRRHRDVAARTGARIVHSCGFDAIPSDLGVYALHRRASADGAGPLTDTTFVAREAATSMSGGTLASAVALFREASRNPELRRSLGDPYTLTVDRGAEPDLGRQPDLVWRRGRDIAPELDGIWTAGFVLAPYNTRLVRYSNALQDWRYGRTLRYAEALSMGSARLSPAAAVAATIGGNGLLYLGTRFAHLLPQRVLGRMLPDPGTGPTEEVRKAGHYWVQTYTTTADGSRYRTSIRQQGDPGYQATSVLLGESALTLALHRERLSDARGVLTPAVAMGDLLLERLPAAGVSIETDRLPTDG